MKLRNLLMTAVLLITIGSSFAFKSITRSLPGYSINLGTTSNPICVTSQNSHMCSTSYTGPQCTVYDGLVLKPIWEIPFPAGPICVTPLRQYQP